MTELFITMNSTGTFTMPPSVGRIEEYCARTLRIALNTDFLSSSISYYTLSFEPYSLSRKIITENIYRDSSTSEGIYYADGCIFCPIYDYIAVSPTVAVQIDAYETDSLGNVTAIIKSGIFNLEFAPSLTGEGMMLHSVRPDVKFYENVSNAVDKALETLTISGEKIDSYSITGRKIAPDSIGVPHLQEASVTTIKIKKGAVKTDCLAEGSVSEEKLINGSVTEEKIAKDAVTTDKLSDKNVTSSKLADSAVTEGKLADYCVSEEKIRPSAVSSSKLADGAVTPAKLDREYITHHQSLDGFATEKWVKEQNYLTKDETFDKYATEEWVKEQNYLTEHQSLSGYATEDWVHEQNYLSANEGLRGYATEQWVESKGYLTSDEGFLKGEDLPEKLSELENDVAVSYNTQVLTEAQKQIARDNIGAVKSEEGKYLSQNDFTDEDKEKLDAALTEHQDISMKADTSSLATVAFSGSYNDLSDLPDNSAVTDELKDKYDKAYAHAVSEHAPPEAEENVIESITVNGKTAEINEKNISLCIIGYDKKETVFMEVF